MFPDADRQTMTPLAVPSAVVEVAWLQAHLHHPQLVVLDASWYLPGQQRDAHQEYEERHIPGARFFDFDREICASDTPLPHMLPGEQQFQQQARRLGLRRDSAVVIYDGLGMFSSPRAWWMLRAMGHTNCAVLNGGLPAWLKAGGETQQGRVDPHEGDFCAAFQPQWLAECQQVLATVNGGPATVVDARPAARFCGEAAEPRPGLARGHIPGSVNLPFSLFVEGGYLKPEGQLQALLEDLTDTQQLLICSCGSGVTACIVALAAFYAGYPKVAVYDGSWAEWGSDPRLPVCRQGH